jgi:hypothetical protein
VQNALRLQLYKARGRCRRFRVKRLLIVAQCCRKASRTRGHFKIWRPCRRADGERGGWVHTYFISSLAVLGYSLKTARLLAANRPRPRSARKFFSHFLNPSAPSDD